MANVVTQNQITREIKGDIFAALRTALTAPASSKSKKSWTEAFIEQMLAEARKEPSGPLGQLVAKQIMQEDILSKLDAETDKALAKDVDFLEYRLMKLLYDKQREVFLDDMIHKKILIGSRRIGKCWGKGTLIRKFDGSTVAVEDIKVGDVLMSPDSLPVTVLSTTTGKDTMYKVYANVRNSKVEFICNSAHILTVKRTCKYTWRGYKFGEVYDIPLNEFISFPKREQEHFSLYRAEIEYPEQKHNIDPYLLGLWLGDGDKNCPQITIEDQESDLINYIKANYDYYVKIDTRRHNVKTYYLRGIIDFFREENLISNKHIPKSYKIDSRENRLKVLAGLIDSDGYLLKGMRSIEISSSNETLKDDIFELCNSLGFKTLIRSKQAKLYGVPKKVNYVITIKGNLDEIPNVLQRKHTSNSKQRPVYGFSIEEIGPGDYYGFTVTGNGRVILADYIVTHNTTVATRLMVKDCIRPNRHALFIGLKFETAINLAFDETVRVAESVGLVITKKSKNDGNIEFTNGSKITFKGNYTVRDQDTNFQGDHYSLVVIDEVQSQKNVQHLIDDLLRPAMTDYPDSTMLLTGTPPRIKGTYAEKIWKEFKGWKHYSWTMAENPFIINESHTVESIIEDICKEKGITPDAPFIKREYFGSWEYDLESMVFKDYQKYKEIPATFIPTDIAIGTDYGFSDYNSIIALAYNRTTSQAYVISERKFNKATVTDIINACKEVFEYCKKFAIERNSNFDFAKLAFYCDTSDQSITYELNTNYKIPAYNCYKYDKKMAIAQLSDWCRTGKIMIPEDGILQDEFERTVYKRDEQDNITSEIDDDLFHPDATDALLYASRQYAYDCGYDSGGQSSDKERKAEEARMSTLPSWARGDYD